LLAVWLGSSGVAAGQCPNNADRQFVIQTYGAPPCGNFDSRITTSYSANLFNVVNGAAYEVSTCNTPGTANLILTLYNNGNGAFIGFNDDNGPLCAGNKASIGFTAGFTGTVKALVNPFRTGFLSNCHTNPTNQTNPLVVTSVVLDIRQVNNIDLTQVGGTICQNNTKILQPQPAGGTWSVLSGTATIQNGNELVPGTNFTGPITLRYDLGACSQTVAVGVAPPFTRNSIITTDPLAYCTTAPSVLLNANSPSDPSVPVVVEWFYTEAPNSCPQNGGGISAGTGQLFATPAGVTVTRNYQYFVSGSFCDDGWSPNCITVTVTPPPVPVVSGATALCAGGSTTLTASGADTYSWSDGGNVLNGASQILSPSSTTTYTVTGFNAGCSATTTVTVTVNPLPVVSVSGITTLCSGGSTTLTASGAGSYTWFDGANTLSGATQVLAPASTTTYTVTGTNGSGCSATTVITVSVNAPISVTVNAIDAACTGNELSAVVSGGTAPYSYSWSNGSTDAAIQNVAAGSYTVTVTDAVGCLQTASASLANNAPVSIVADGIVNATDNSTPDGSVGILIQGGTAPFTYLWSTGATSEDLANVLPGTYTVTVSDAAGCSQTASFTVGSNAAVCTYALNAPASISCAGGTYSVCLDANAPVNAGIIGLDVTIRFPQGVVVPAAAITPGSVVLNSVGNDLSLVGSYVNTNTQGEVNLIVFYNSGNPGVSQLSGAGNVLCVDFTPGINALPGTPVPFDVEVVESYASNISFACAQPGASVVVANNSLDAAVIYRNDAARPLAYDATNPAAFNATTIDLLDAANQTVVASTNPNLNGEFSLLVAQPSEVRITRDIDNSACPVVLPVINGFDAYLISLIATADLVSQPNFPLQNGIPTPSAYDLIAADVNGDGFVTAGDVTILQQRAVLTRCNFPGDRDWVFVNDDLLALPAFQPSSVYPVGDGVGYSRFNVPAVPAQLGVEIASNGNGCTSVVSEVYHAIMIGDVDGNWTLADAQNLRTAADVRILLDAARAEETASGLRIPVQVESTDVVKSIDLTWQFAQNGAQVASVNTGVHTPADVQLTSSNSELHQAAFVSTMSKNGFEVGQEELMWLTVSNATRATVQQALTRITGYVNGKKTPVAFKTANSVNTSFSSAINVYPNPATDALTVETALTDGGSVSAELVDALGRTVVSERFVAVPGTNAFRLSLAGLVRGVYTLKLVSGGQVAQLKVVKQ
jgi:hypothetical protein